MSTNINWTISAQIAGGPKLAESDVQTVEAYDMVDVSIDAGAVDQVIELQPSAGQMNFLMITSSVYDADNLTFKIDGGDPVHLDSPQMLIGSGIMALLGSGALDLQFTNALSTDADIKILVGRDITSDD